ncbi:hypothetical protein SMA90_32205, partial [Escherichia coli]
TSQDQGVAPQTYQDSPYSATSPADVRPTLPPADSMPGPVDGESPSAAPSTQQGRQPAPRSEVYPKPDKNT